MPQESGWKRVAEGNGFETLVNEVYATEDETLFDCWIYANRVYGDESKYFVLMTKDACVVSRRVKSDGKKQQTSSKESGGRCDKKVSSGSSRRSRVSDDDEDGGYGVEGGGRRGGHRGR